MSLAVRLGKRGNLLEPGPGAYSQVRMAAPVRSALACWPALLQECVSLILLAPLWCP